ncbi:hypothetical protein NE237_020688 [Protea cynaroides]|uniref:Uncharacterized protein n=1 Tax=Protea cynaroides TaxID=273540 RepID=A0A9Q0H745_9MAGN|nr:hypothetical protein NE237_020688 [Protea cynaroides]
MSSLLSAFCSLILFLSSCRCNLQPSTDFGFQFPFRAPQSTPFTLANAQLTTQMLPIGRLPFSVADHDTQHDWIVHNRGAPAATFDVLTKIAASFTLPGLQSASLVC